MYIQPLFKIKNSSGLLLNYKLINYNGLTQDTIRAVLEHGVKNG